MRDETVSSYSFCGAKLTPWCEIDVSKVRRLLLIAMCGSFNPIHEAHTAMYDAAWNALMRETDGTLAAEAVVGGFVSPVNDGYGKECLRPFAERAAMCAASLAGHPSLSVDEWEGRQPTYVRTFCVLDHLQRAAQKWYEDDAGPSEAQRAWVRQNPVRVVFVCGSDLFASFLRPGCWPLGLLKRLLDSFDVLVVRRVGSPGCAAILRQSDPVLQERVQEVDGSTTLLTLDLSVYHFKEADLYDNPISSTTIRDLLAADPAANLRGLVPASGEALIRACYTGGVSLSP
ncbi:nicotinamide mononucleotide adenylyltransferase [Trypanosoma grayi]|uniref:nicotinamide mononucleotide adenylyltransferase n=1 Tax=Trypanosoma grayi TaxID=71804 RepID=UPI0004F46D9A|nr:nicotinamide mononucleotide adenylyltransferase [Trypanosoma grayi]KEG14810.1 nicotinamide mononucleotide adenylyltransferase [Trypanosoma grayi]